MKPACVKTKVATLCYLQFSTIKLKLRYKIFCIAVLLLSQNTPITQYLITNKGYYLFTQSSLSSLHMH